MQMNLTSVTIFFHSLQINCEPPSDPPGGVTEATIIVSFKQSLAGQTNTYSLLCMAYCTII